MKERTPNESPQTFIGQQRSEEKHKLTVSVTFMVYGI